MGLSSNILWHQTQKDALKKILKQKSFRYSYSLEHVEAKNDTLECAFPMLSLCDIPFADIEDYLTKYGGNSIGLSREWGKRHGITPVVYCDPSSSLLNDSLGLIRHNMDNGLDIFVAKLFSHIKNHEGKLPKYNYKKYRFYDEREVRITPSLDELDRFGHSPVLLKREYTTYKARNSNRSLLSNKLTIPFSYNDIRYFILRNEDSISEIKEILSKEINLSESNIGFFTIKQVREDIIGANHNETDTLVKININNNLDNFPPIVEKINL